MTQIANARPGETTVRSKESLFIPNARWLSRDSEGQEAQFTSAASSVTLVNSRSLRDACAMRKRTAVLAATFMTLVGFTVPVVGASAQTAPVRPDIFPSEWCGNQAPPCVVSASRNGIAITESDPTYAVSASGSLQ